MSSFQQERQSELFSGENWSTIYQAFSNVSLQSYDFDTIRSAMVSYIQTNQPESFNDWISSSEFVMIIDLLAYLGQSLAFRIELNSRENFMDTAERRESILRIAKMLNYSPKRNFSARGLLKLVKIRTDQEIRDIDGTNLTNIDIAWNDPTNTNWFEQFVLVLNNTFASTNPYGIPVKQSAIGGIATQLYQLNSAPLTTVSDPFNVVVNGTSTRFESVNPDFDVLGFFTERAPNPIGAKHLIYRNDGSGNSSPNTGFFTYFKQGNLQSTDFQFDFPQENRIVDINVKNINELDVWVEEIDNNGLVISTWTQVPTTDNIAFTNIDRQNRKIYSVITRDNDQISIKFGDGRFGQAPTGIFRVWYRVSNGLRYQIRTSNMENIQIAVPYLVSTNNATQKQTLTLTFSLQYGLNTRDVGASVPRETTAQIQQRAGQVYYTQNRMVNGEDYNVFPLQYGNLVKKVKSVNRIYSGQSRYIDINDPTGRYQNTTLFSDDGILYKENFSRNTYESLPSVKTPIEMIIDDIQPLLTETDLRDFYFANYPRPTIDNNPYPTRWRQPINNLTSISGQFAADTSFSSTYIPQPIGYNSNNNYVYLTKGSLVKFQDPASADNYIWASIEKISTSGIDPNIDVNGYGPVILSQSIPDQWRATLTIPSFRQTLTTDEINAIERQIENKNSFALRYDYLYGTWNVIASSNIDVSQQFDLTYAGNTANANLDASWLLLAEYLPSQGYWQFSTRNLRYVFESVNDARFFFVDDFRVTDIQRNLPLRDYIRILKYNTLNSPSTSSLGRTYDFELVNPFVYSDGFIEPRRVQVSFTDSNNTGIPDNPDIFDLVVDPNAQIEASDPKERRVYHILQTDGDYEYYVPDTTVLTFNFFSDITTNTLTANQVGYAIDRGIFYKRTNVGALLDVSNQYQSFVGRASIAFQWKHFVPSDQRIDPSSSNIMDMYVLTENYYQATQNWLKSVTRSAFPTPPSTEDLRQQFAPLEIAKMQSDEIIWHSAKFKLLFGSEASQELQAQFKVIKVAGTTVTDNEIKQMIINGINQFFDVSNWAFGESFYFTELAAYLHQSLSTIIASVVIVPNSSNNKFGNLFVVRSEPDQLFMSTATVGDVLIVSNYNQSNIRIGQ